MGSSRFRLTHEPASLTRAPSLHSFVGNFIATTSPSAPSRRIPTQVLAGLLLELLGLYRRANQLHGMRLKFGGIALSGILMLAFSVSGWPRNIAHFNRRPPKLTECWSKKSCRSLITERGYNNKELP